MPSTIVTSSQLTVALRLLVCAARTASAIVSELPIRTAVLNRPHEIAIDLLACGERLGVPRAVERCRR